MWFSRDETGTVLRIFICLFYYVEDVTWGVDYFGRVISCRTWFSVHGVGISSRFIPPWGWVWFLSSSGFFSTSTQIEGGGFPGSLSGCLRRHPLYTANSTGWRVFPGVLKRVSVFLV